MSATFSGSKHDLFSPDEIQTLMRGEFDRAQRYSFPIVCMMIAVDRIESLNDLYGYESKEDILTSVVDLLKNVTRASDFLGCLIDDRILAVFPHTSPQVASTLTRRLLERARELRFEDNGRRLGITLSIGVAHNQHDEQDITFSGMVQVAKDGLEVADRSGGDRFVQTEVYSLYKDNEPSAPLPREKQDKQKAAELRERGRKQRSMHPTLMDAGLEGTFVAKFQALLDATSDRSMADKLRQEFLQMALNDLAQEHHSAQEAESSAEKDRQIDNLERRISKLNAQLGLTEDELKRVMAMKDVETGVASMYRTVQGLSDEDASSDVKKEMMKQIFEANIEMKKAFKSEA